ncbi:hypothetical protein K439DRAFT_485892 [Ramaria rubella]|nr:hypothetical protein K439DRAFT_485892 [Ramaria rubella]
MGDRYLLLLCWCYLISAMRRLVLLGRRRCGYGRYFMTLCECVTEVAPDRTRSVWSIVRVHMSRFRDRNTIVEDRTVHVKSPYVPISNQPLTQPAYSLRFLLASPTSIAAFSPFHTASQLKGTLMRWCHGTYSCFGRGWTELRHGATLFRFREIERRDGIRGKLLSSFKLSPSALTTFTRTPHLPPTPLHTTALKPARPASPSPSLRRWPLQCWMR